MSFEHANIPHIPPLFCMTSMLHTLHVGEPTYACCVLHVNKLPCTYSHAYQYAIVPSFVLCVSCYVGSVAISGLSLNKLTPAVVPFPACPSFSDHFDLLQAG